MLDNFKKIYDDELRQLEASMTALDTAIFNHHDTRAFVYEVCEQVVATQPSVQPKNCVCGIGQADKYCGACGGLLYAATAHLNVRRIKMTDADQGFYNLIEALQKEADKMLERKPPAEPKPVSWWRRWRLI